MQYRPGPSGIGFSGVTVAYGATVALDALELEVAPGEIMALIGPSGCGKTTALRAVAGFVRPVSGRVRIGETDVTDLPPQARGIGMVVQNYALFPHMRVADNVAFGLRARGVPARAAAERVRECLALVGMAEFAARYPRQLSGGQQQRVAIARAIAIRPRVMLLDEPLSALDAQIRRSMVEELARLHRDLPNITILYVTHDQAEALTLADRIAIMRDGRLVAQGPASEVYRAPPNRFAAEFLGRANLLAVFVEGIDDGFVRVRLGDDVLHVTAPAVAMGGRALLCVRPHDIALAPPREGRCNRVEAEVRAARWLGERHSLTLDVAGQEVRISTAPLRDPPMPHARVALYFAAEDATLLPYGAG